MNKLKYLLLLGVFTFVFACSTEKSPLEQLEAKEAKVKETETDLLLGLQLGMDKQAFYEYCKVKNESGEFMDGGEFHQVLYEYKDEFSTPVDFWFYQKFEADQIVKQESKFKYKAWAPWNEEKKADQLMPEVLDFLSKTFGDDFIELETGNKTKRWVDIDANRRIDVYTKLLDDAYVYMDVMDLRKQ